MKIKSMRGHALFGSPRPTVVRDEIPEDGVPDDTIRDVVRILQARGSKSDMQAAAKLTAALSNSKGK